MSGGPDPRDGAPESSGEPRRSNAATLIGALLIVALIAAGVWLLNRIDDSKKAQECLESGRRNCRIIESTK